MSNEERRKMIDRIVHLMAVADSATFDGEAEAAKAMAAKLMAKYQIDTQELIKDVQPEYTVEEQSTIINPQIHERMLQNAIAMFCGVLFLVVKKASGDKYIRLVGTKELIDDFYYMLDLVKSQQTHALNMLRGNLSIIERPFTSVEKRAFFNGYAIGVNNKVWDMKHAANKQFEEWGLVPIDQLKAASDWYEDHRGQALTTAKSRALKCSDSGLAAGRKVSLNKGVSFQGTGAIMIGN